VKTVCVIGLGYIGLPTAAMFATHGARVFGVDVNAQVVKTLSSGEVHLHEPGIRAFFRSAIAGGNLTIHDKPQVADAYIIAVPTPFKKGDRPVGAAPESDVSYVVSAAKSLLPLLKPGDLVILESTSPPRTTSHVVKPILEQSGLRAGVDFNLAYSPERVLPGHILKELVENDRVIGGITPACAEAGRALYGLFVTGQIMLTEATTAEMVKLMENTYRDVNIALANEFASVAEHVSVNVWEAISLANHHPRVKILRPGPGVGGHCIAVDPWFIVEAAPEAARIIADARRTNDAAPHRVVESVMRLLNKANKNGHAPIVACLGLAYKANIDDARESPAVEIVNMLRSKQLDVRAFDPWVAPGAVAGQVDSLAAAVADADVVVLLTDHESFRALKPADLAGAKKHALYDARNAIDAKPFLAAGWTVTVLGIGSAEHEGQLTEIGTLGH
jgi:UDP-N-acetyl-D-mannosaminuronic acid dehydrogenase